MRRSIRGFNIPLGNLPPPTPPQKLSLNAPPPQKFLAKDIISNCDFVHIDQALKPRSWSPFILSHSLMKVNCLPLNTSLFKDITL